MAQTLDLNVRLVGLWRLTAHLWLVQAVAALSPRLVGRVWHVSLASKFRGRRELVMRPKLRPGPGTGGDNVIVIDLGARAWRAWRVRKGS